MRSLRSKLTVTMLCVIFAVIMFITLLSVIFIRSTASRKSDQLLLMLCENGQYSLNYYFDSVESSVNNITTLVESDLNGLDDEQFAAHMERSRKFFESAISQTDGILTYYYRIDPSVSSTVKGFWYTNLDGKGFKEHTVTDITQYDVNDTSKLVWFTVPKFEGRSIWLPPYITDNLDVRVISYDAPIYYNGQFIGVVGIELDYSAMAKEVDSIKFYDNGYAFLSGDDGRLFYHPYIDVVNLHYEDKKMPYSYTDGSNTAKYVYNGVVKKAVWLPLSNGMHLNITVPVDETEGEWRGLIINILACAVIAMIVAGFFLVATLGLITRPLEQLIDASEQVDKGNFDVNLQYNKDDEIGRLTKSFMKLAGNMKAHINALNEQIFIDSLTHVRNKGAFVIAIDELQEQINNGSIDPHFAIGTFDCDGLKRINDQYGHDKGDIYLKGASQLICHVFRNSSVFRIGGDEFAVIIENQDFRNMEGTIKSFYRRKKEICDLAENEWDEVNISIGIATFDPDQDENLEDTIRRADKIMYDNKRVWKKNYMMAE